MRTMLTMPNIVYIIISNVPPTVYTRYTAFSNISKLLFVLHILALTKFQLRWYAPFQLLWTLFKSSFLPLRSLCKSDLQCFPIFRNCGLFWHFLVFTKFLLRWMRTMLTMVKVVQFIISDIAQTGYIRFTGFWNFSKLLFVLHILAFTKFQLRWCAPFQLLGTLFKSSFLQLLSLCK